MHQHAHEDSVPLTLAGVDPEVLDVRILTALGLAVSSVVGNISAAVQIVAATAPTRG